MPTFIKSKNSPVFANFLAENTAPNTGNQFFAATEISLDFNSALEVNRVLNQTPISNDFNSSGPIQSKLSFEYYPLIGDNSVLSVENQTGIFALSGDFVSGHQIQFGNFLLKRCYLSNLEIRIVPQEPILFKADFDVYDTSSVTGQSYTGANILNTLSSRASYLDSIHALAIGVSGSGVALPNSKNSISISTSCARSPVYSLGGIYPDTTILESVSRTTQIRGENIGQVINFSGTNGLLDLQFNPFSWFITGGSGFNANNGLFGLRVDGRVSTQSLSATPDNTLDGQITLVENIF
jgi:hypothetical protein